MILLLLVPECNQDTTATTVTITFTEGDRNLDHDPYLQHDHDQTRPGEAEPAKVNTGENNNAEKTGEGNKAGRLPCCCCCTLLLLMLLLLLLLLTLLLVLLLLLSHFLLPLLLPLPSLLVLIMWLMLFPLQGRGGGG